MELRNERQVEALKREFKVSKAKQMIAMLQDSQTELLIASIVALRLPW